MTSTEQTLTSADGTVLAGRLWETATEPRAAVCLVHGLGEHSGRYEHVGARLVAGGYAVESFDLRGHGRSPGGRGVTPFDRTMDDIDALLADAAARCPGRPRFLYGHSLGGLLVLTYVLRRQPDLAGVVVSGAGLRSPVLEQRVKMTAARLLGSLLPTVTMPSGLDDTGISRDPAVVEAYRADPLVHDKASLGLGKEGAVGATWALANAARFPLPLLIMHGGDDRLTYPRGSEEFAAQVTGDCTLTIYDGLYHEVHNEPEQAQVLDDVVAWLDAHLPASDG